MEQSFSQQQQAAASKNSRSRLLQYVLASRLVTILAVESLAIAIRFGFPSIKKLRGVVPKTKIETFGHNTSSVLHRTEYNYVTSFVSPS